VPFSLSCGRWEFRKKCERLRIVRSVPRGKNVNTMIEDSVAQITQQFAAQGLYQAFARIPLAAYIGQDPIEDFIVLQDMAVDEDFGVRVQLTAGIATKRILLIVDVDPHDEKNTAVAVRAIPLTSIVEVRAIARVDHTNDSVVEAVHGEIVTVEFGTVSLSTTICGGPLMDGKHVNINELDEESAQLAEVCTDSDGFAGDVMMNSVMFTQTTSISGPEVVEDIRRFLASVSRLVSQR
jgi:hypothetical protein